ncbi:MAG: hypothetical protein JWP61_1535 [Friedmanniella sp.]|nr:hypothetical protein [Friedmanniella sp.]
MTATPPPDSPDLRVEPASADPRSDLAPAVPGAPTVKQTERPHPLTPFIRGWLVFVALAFGLGRELIPDGSGDNRFPVTNLAWLLLLILAAMLLAATAGFVSWWFTRFVIDDDELRIETGAVFKSSKKIPFERLQSVDLIQPLAARMFGLAELRLEAGAGDSTTRLRYLRRSKAAALRDYLLTRAHGQRTRLSDVDSSPTSAFTDLAARDHPLVVVPPQRLVLGFLLSSEWLISAVITVLALTLTTTLGVSGYALTGLIPLLFGAVSLVGRRVVAMFRFTLSESTRGLRVTRGLTNLTSQSVPIDRIQGVKITQPLLWRRMGWSRGDVDIVGYGRSSGEDNDTAATSVLLPVATRAEVELALGRVLPAFDLGAITMHSMPQRPRWYRWYDFWTLHYGWNERAIVTEHGWLNRVRDIVPHAKTQSVRIEQGPLQRRLRLANVHIDTPRGPVNAVAQELAVADARELALSQLDRARAARTADRERVPVDQVGAGSTDRRAEDDLLAAFGTSRDRLLGAGGESEVFALDHRPDQERELVLRLYRSGHEAPLPTATQLRGLYEFWGRTDIGLELPVITDLGQRAGRVYSVDRRFSGRNLSPWLATAEVDERRTALASLLDAAAAVQRLPAPVPGFARLVGDGAPQTFPTLVALADAMLAGPTRESRDQLTRDRPDVAAVWDQLHRDLSARVVTPAVVHGDICAPNAYVSPRADGSPVVTGLGDFSPHTVTGDPLMDLTGAVAFVELEGYPGAAEDAAWLEALAVQRWGDAVPYWIGVYRRFYGFYFSNAYAFDPALYGWCLRQLAA